MKRKMIVSYSLPVILISALVFFVGMPFLTKQYEKQMRYATSQSLAQTMNFVQNHMDNMQYVGELIQISREIREILEEPLGNYSDKAEAYREFYNLNTAFRNVEMTNENYRIGIYVSDKIEYANNNYYFYPQSELESMEYYDEMMEALDKNERYYSIITEARSSAPDKQDDYMASFSKIKFDYDGKTKVYVVKVEVLLDDMNAILEKGKTTEDTLVYYVNSNQRILLASDDEVLNSLQVDDIFLKGRDQWSVKNIAGRNYYIVYQKIDDKREDVLCALIPMTQFREQVYGIYRIAMLLVVFIAGCVVLISHFLEKYYVGRLNELGAKMNSIKNGEITAGISYDIKSGGDEIDEIDRNFNYMSMELNRLMKEHYKLGKNVVSAELKALQAQINPHFLYNTLDLINWGALDHGAIEVADMARNLGQFYRLSLNHGKVAIKIDEELKHVEAFINIEKMHFPGAIELNINVPQEIRALACLNIILQPFVENAIVHGIAEHPDIIECNIDITAKRVEDDIEFVISDDGMGMDEKQLKELIKFERTGSSKGYGVKNINFRLKLCYGEKYGVRYESELMEGTKVYLRIPAMELEELDKMLEL